MAVATTYLYRAMQEKNGLPKLGTTATTLAVREQTDILVDEKGEVVRPEFRRGQPNGISCSPSVAELPVFAFPVEWGGTHRRTRVWRIQVDDLEPDLIAGADGPGHISIGPSRRMPFVRFVEAVQNTAPLWELVLPEPDISDEHET